MTMTFQTFKNRILGDLLPTFCNHPSRGWGCEGFKEDWKNVSEKDAIDFIVALDAGLIEYDKERGLYRAQKSFAGEQFFWEGRKNIFPRPITLWIEPIITMAVLARLHFKWGWPKELIGTQSRHWEFDVTAYATTDLKNEFLACEVKKTVAELDQMVELMQRFSTDSNVDDIPKSPKEKNAFRKLKGLQARQASVFWAAGPNGVSKVFRMTYADKGKVFFKTASEDALTYTGL